jgi:hypothetical protein
MEKTEYLWADLASYKQALDNVREAGNALEQAEACFEIVASRLPEGIKSAPAEWISEAKHSIGEILNEGDAEAEKFEEILKAQGAN